MKPNQISLDLHLPPDLLAAAKKLGDMQAGAIEAIYWGGFQMGACAGFVAGFLVCLLLVYVVTRKRS